MNKYLYEDGEYVLVDAEHVFFRADEIALSFSKEGDGMWTLHKHGRKEPVQKHHEETVKKYVEHGYLNMAASMVMIVGKFPVDELNKCLHTTGYIQKMCEKMELDI